MLRARVDRPRCIGAGNCMRPRRPSTGTAATSRKPASRTRPASTRRSSARPRSPAPPSRSSSRRSRNCSRGSSAAARRPSASSAPSCSPTSSGRRASSRRWGTGVAVAPVLARQDAPRDVRREPGRGGDGDRRRVLRGVRVSRRCARMRGRDPTGARRTSQQRRVRAAGADRRARLRRDDGRTELHRQGSARSLQDRRARRGGQIVASAETAAGGQFPTKDARTVTVKGISDPIEVVTVDWR